MQVDLATDEIIANGYRVVIPPKFDNTANPAETEQDRERYAELLKGRTGVYM